MEEENEEKNKIIDDSMDDDAIMDDSIDDELEIIDKSEEKENITEEEIKKLEIQIAALQGAIKENRFPRSENKTDFASGVINVDETKKIANLDEGEIYDLIDKRKFYNFLTYFGWEGLAQRLIANVRDVEDYSLSRSGKLLDNVFIDRTRNEAKSIQEERRSKNEP